MATTRSVVVVVVVVVVVFMNSSFVFVAFRARKSSFHVDLCTFW
jgi:hypothetical protein